MDREGIFRREFAALVEDIATAGQVQITARLQPAAGVIELICHRRDPLTALCRSVAVLPESAAVE